MREFEFQFPDGPLINRELLESTVSELQKSLNLQRQDMKTGWVWYRFPPCLNEDMTLAISLAFSNGVLRQVNIAHNDGALYGDSWNDWSEEREKLRVKNTVAWFTKQGYSLGIFPWGEIWASYDPKGGFGSGGVRYAET